MKRILVSLFVGVLFPGLAFILVVFSAKVFLGPGPVPRFLIYVYAWPFLTPVFEVWCRILPVPSSTIAMLLIGYLLDALSCAIALYAVLTFIKRKKHRPKHQPQPPLPSAFQE